MNTLQYLESILHTVVVAMLGKPQRAFRLSKTTFVEKVGIKFDYFSKPAYCRGGNCPDKVYLGYNGIIGANKILPLKKQNSPYIQNLENTVNAVNFAD